MKLISADTLKLLNVLDYMHYILLGPLQIVFTFSMVYLDMGKSALLSLCILILAIPIQIFLTRKLVRNREVLMAILNILIFLVACGFGH